MWCCALANLGRANCELRFFVGASMIALDKIIAKCDFHIKRGENMVMGPDVVKELVQAAQAAKAADINSQLLRALKSVFRGGSFGCDEDENAAKSAIAAAIAKHGGTNG